MGAVRRVSSERSAESLATLTALGGTFFGDGDVSRGVEMWRLFLVGLAGLIALAGCESDVDFCGGDRVCGADGRSYEDHCAAASAGVNVEYVGACVDGCDEVCEIACPYGLAVDGEGCPICECAPPPRCDGDDVCVGGDVCVDGRCGPPRPMDDAGERDVGHEDAGSDAGPPPCIGTQVRCGDECVELGTLTNCSSCGDICEVPETRHHRDVRCGAEDGATTMCTQPCLDGYADCGEPTDSCETPLGTTTDCTECGDACAHNAECGDDGCACPDSLATLCSTGCVDVESDNSHCGYCGRACEGFDICITGECVDRRGCGNPENWDCAIDGGACLVVCRGDILYGFDDGDGEFACNAPRAAACLPPPRGATCADCRQSAARCCGPVAVPSG